MRYFREVHSDGSITFADGPDTMGDPPAPIEGSISEIAIAEMVPPVPGCIPTGIDENGHTTWTTPSVSLEEIQKKAKETLSGNMNAFYEKKPDGSPRYDALFRESVPLYALAHGGLQAEPLPALFAWKAALYASYVALDNAIEQAQSSEAVAQIDISIDQFEARYGQNGTESADPGITIAQIMAL